MYIYVSNSPPAVHHRIRNVIFFHRLYFENGNARSCAPTYYTQYTLYVYRQKTARRNCFAIRFCSIKRISLQRSCSDTRDSILIKNTAEKMLRCTDLILRKVQNQASD